MIIIQDQKFGVEFAHDRVDGSAGDLPPAYDGLSIYPAANHAPIREASSSSFPGPVAGSSSHPPSSDTVRRNPHVLDIDRALQPRPPSPSKNPPLTNVSAVPARGLRTGKSTSWLSLLPFVSALSAKRVRQSVLSTVGDLVVPPSRAGSEEQTSIREIFASITETCAQHKLSLSAILQEQFIATHTPMYWAIVHYRQELLVALLVHSRPLSSQAISDIRRACLVSSNQALFHALRVCSPPFHRTDGIQVPSLRAAADNLLLGGRPLDEIYIIQTTEQSFVVSFDIPLWQRRMKAIGRVGIEFIASSRMWSVTFFSTDSSSSTAASGKSKKLAMNTRSWYIMVNLLELSPPTYFDLRFVVDVPPPLVRESILTPRLREARSTTFPPSRGERYQSWSPTYGHNYDRKAYSRPSRGHNGFAPSSSSLTLLPPAHPLRGSPSSIQSSTTTPPPISIHFGCGNRKLGCWAGSGAFSEPLETPTTKPDTWSDHGVGYTNAAVSPLGQGLGSQLLYDHSPYLFPDGTLRGRLEARFVKFESSKDCVIC